MAAIITMTTASEAKPAKIQLVTVSMVAKSSAPVWGPMGSSGIGSYPPTIDLTTGTNPLEANAMIMPTEAQMSFWRASPTFAASPPAVTNWNAARSTKITVNTVKMAKTQLVTISTRPISWVPLVGPDGNSFPAGITSVLLLG